MITNKDIRVENGSLILNGDPYPLDGQSPEAIMEIVEDNSDTTPTENSDAPITSGGVFTADKAISDTIGDITQTGVTGATVAAQLTTLDDKIDDMSTATLGSSVNLKAYSSAENKYTCPSDGYVRMACWRQMETVVYVNGVDLLKATDASGSPIFMTIFVKKGMQIHYTSSNTNDGVLTFIPFVYGD